jgi:hypothetical protein
VNDDEESTATFSNHATQYHSTIPCKIL